MDKFLYEIFKTIPDEQTPGHLHTATMKRVLFSRLQHIAVAIAVVASVSFVFSLWHLYAKMIELDFIATARLVASSLEFDMASITDAFSSMAAFTPINAVVFAFLNFIAFGFSLYLVRTFKRMQMFYF